MLVSVPLALSRENISVVVPALSESVSGEEAFFLALCFLAWETPVLKTLKRRNHIYCSSVMLGGCIGVRKYANARKEVGRNRPGQLGSGSESEEKKEQ